MRKLRWISAAAAAGATLAFATLAFADGPPETPRRQAAPPPQEPVRAAPLQPAQPAPQPAPPTATAPPAQQTAAPPAAATASGPQTGTLSLADGAVSLTVPTGFEFWDAATAQAYLQRVNAAPPPGQVLGMVAPAGTQPAGADFWGTVVSYEPIGHVAADSASTLQASSLEADVRNARQGEQRPFEGFVMQPAFDAAGGTLSWAERTAAAPAPTVRDLRHEQRLLGRSGAVSLTTIARSDQQGAVVSAAPAMLSAASFPAGQRYADFNAASDNRSGYTLGDLVKGAPSGPAAETAAATSAPNALTSSTTDGAGGGLQGWFPWIAVGVVALAAIGWFAMGRRNRDLDDDEDEEDVAVAERKDEPKPEAT